MSIRIFILTLLSLLAFAGNSFLSRLALKGQGMDAASFACIRMVSGALTLWLLTQLLSRNGKPGGNWTSAIWLLIYALPFTFAYVTLPAASGTLLSFGMVQLTMIGAGLWRGERLSSRQWCGLALAIGGILALLLPSASTPPLRPSIMIMVAGLGWGVYSLRGRSSSDPLRDTAGNFLRAAPLCLVCCLPFLSGVKWEPHGAVYAVLCGVVTSALGYVIWYQALQKLSATVAATVQLSVPIIAAMLAVAFLGEPLTMRFMLTSITVLGGIALVIDGRKKA
ncbi:MAG: DMT family transporter [Micavibrio sp.]|nr:DMT family transporter [Micavibrio sp.]